jgi:hypothetical protein
MVTGLVKWWEMQSVTALANKSESSLVKWMETGWAKWWAKWSEMK